MGAVQQMLASGAASVTYFLDGVSGLTALYSFRRLTTAYSGPAFRARRSSDNAELDFTPSGTALITFATVNAWSAGTAFMVKWYDQSGNGRDAAQAVAGLQPQLVAAANGIALQFDGSNDTMKTATFAQTQPLTINLVYRYITDLGGQNVVYSGFSDYRVAMLGDQGVGYTNGIYAGSSVLGDSTLTDMPIGTRGAVGATYNGGSSLLEVNSSAIVSLAGATGTDNCDGLTFGMTAGGGTPSNMELQEFLMFSGAQISATIKTRNAAMRTAWGF